MARGMHARCNTMAIRDDLIYAARSLRKTPGLVSVVVLTLALGIGVNTTAFNLLNLLVLAPPSAKEPGRCCESNRETAI